MPAGDEQALTAAAGGSDGAELAATRKRLQRLRRRTRVTGLLLPLLAALLAWLLADDLAYFVQGRQPLELGRAEELTSSRLPVGRYVRLSGIARDMCIRSDLLGGTVKFSFLMGSEQAVRILLETPAASDEPCLGAEEGTFTGQLLAVAENQRYQPVVTHYRQHFTSAPAQGPMYLLRDGRRPGSAWWAPALLAALLLLWLWNLWLAWRLRDHQL